MQITSPEWIWAILIALVGAALAFGIMRNRGGMWCVYEFEWQLDAIQFWDAFEGRWLRGSEFHYPDRPKDLPELKRPTRGASKRDPDKGWL